MAGNGLDALQISSLLILWSVTDLVINIPTGVLADRYSRKTLLSIGQLLKGAGFVSWAILPTYGGFALGFILWGIGGTLEDGTFEALVYDELRTADQQNQYTKVIGQARSWSLIGDLAATVLASVAIMLSYGFVFGASVGVALASALLIYSLPETARFEQVADKRYFSMLKSGISQSIRNKALLAIILLGGFIGGVYGSLEEYVPLLMENTGFNLPVISLAVAATVAIAALASLIAHRFAKLSTMAIMKLLALSGLALTGVGLIGNMGTIALVVTYTFLITLLGVVFEARLQHTITGGLRATISSVSGFALEITAVATYFLYGLIAQRAGNIVAFRTFGIIITIVALLYLLLGRRILSKLTVKSL